MIKLLGFMFDGDYKNIVLPILEKALNIDLSSEVSGEGTYFYKFESTKPKKNFEDIKNLCNQKPNWRETIMRLEIDLRNIDLGDVYCIVKEIHKTYGIIFVDKNGTFIEVSFQTKNED